MNTQISAPDRLLRLDEALKLIPVSKSTWYRGIKEGIYPQPYKLGRRAAAWKLSELKACVEGLEREHMSK